MLGFQLGEKLIKFAVAERRILRLNILQCFRKSFFWNCKITVRHGVRCTFFKSNNDRVASGVECGRRRVNFADQRRIYLRKIGANAAL